MKRELQPKPETRPINFGDWTHLAAIDLIARHEAGEVVPAEKLAAARKAVASLRQSARCIAPLCFPMGCSMCNCAVTADEYARAFPEAAC